MGEETKSKPQDLPQSEAEWRARLPSAVFAVLRRHATEPPGSSPLNFEKRPGVYRCAGCGAPLFSSTAKYESGSGWPSFYAPIAEDALGMSEDRRFFMRRTEVHCARCGGHLGHVFDDGPPPTGLRYCINGLALSFEPASGNTASNA